MPFSKSSPGHTEEYWTRWWQILKRKIEEIPNCTAKRSQALRGDIVGEIIRDLYLADVVIADLTDKNPNVYWELGVRQSLKHGTITIAETKKRIASDMGMKGVLRHYPRDAIKNEEFIQTLKEAIVDCINHPDVSDSHVLETISGRGSLYEIIKREEILRKTDALFDELQYNNIKITYIFDCIKKNKKIRAGKRDKKRPEFTSELLTCYTFSSLLSERYLDENLVFYKQILKYVSIIHAINSHIELWSRNSEEMEKWFETHKKELDTLFTTSTELIKSTHAKVRME